MKTHKTSNKAKATLSDTSEDENIPQNYSHALLSIFSLITDLRKEIGDLRSDYQTTRSDLGLLKEQIAALKQQTISTPNHPTNQSTAPTESISPRPTTTQDPFQRPIGPIGPMGPNPMWPPVYMPDPNHPQMLNPAGPMGPLIMYNPSYPIPGPPLQHAPEQAYTVQLNPNLPMIPQQQRPSSSYFTSISQNPVSHDSSPNLAVPQQNNSPHGSCSSLEQAINNQRPSQSNSTARPRSVEQEASNGKVQKGSIHVSNSRKRPAKSQSVSKSSPQPKRSTNSQRFDSDGSSSSSNSNYSSDSEMEIPPHELIAEVEKDNVKKDETNASSEDSELVDIEENSESETDYQINKNATTIPSADKEEKNEGETAESEQAMLKKRGRQILNPKSASLSGFFGIPSMKTKEASTQDSATNENVKSYENPDNQEEDDSQSDSSMGEVSLHSEPESSPEDDDYFDNEQRESLLREAKGVSKGSWELNPFSQKTIIEEIATTKEEAESEQEDFQTEGQKPSNPVSTSSMHELVNSLKGGNTNIYPKDVHNTLTLRQPVAESDPELELTAEEILASEGAFYRNSKPNQPPTSHSMKNNDTTVHEMPSQRKELPLEF
ncbi:hypothetical protein G6F62_004374 [Rhizopus arrhizus]|nr:hypothetical protein G6F66_003016 [Rhizopus arrhizus]KAG1344748.1 hypothetical protein G6F62_004374 [Rhizopus arrhizus]KAG1405630.1 hypothetical protein G6F60_003488 [Rhizopus arrhizus]